MSPEPKPEVWTEERCYVTEILNDGNWPEVSIARCRVTSGVTTQRHALAVHEVYLIERGSGLVRVGDEAPREVTPGATVSIPKHVPQCITNTGREDLVFTCVCTPKFSQDCYTSLE